MASKSTAQASEECDQALPYTCGSCGKPFLVEMDAGKVRCPWCGACVECG